MASSDMKGKWNYFIVCFETAASVQMKPTWRALAKCCIWHSPHGKAELDGRLSSEGRRLKGKLSRSAQGWSPDSPASTAVGSL